MPDAEFMKALGYRLSEMEVIRVPETEEMVDRVVRHGGRIMVRHTDDGMVIMFKSYEEKGQNEDQGRLPNY